MPPSLPIPMFRLALISTLWLLACVPIYANLDASTVWYGELDSGSRTFRFVVEVPSAQDPASAKATLKSLDEGNALFPLKEFVSDKSTFSFKLNTSTFVGTLSDSQDSISGTWTQGPAKLPLQFRRMDSVPVDNPDEVWLGSISAGPQKLAMQFRGYKQQDGSTRYYFDSVTQKAGGFHATGSRTSEKLELEVPAVKGKYVGTVEGDSIKGKWTQGVVLELNLERIQKPSIDDAKPKRPQHPKAPFPYESRDVTFTSTTGNCELSGTLTTPKGEGRYPVAILISGSGPQDRDETIFDHKPFLVLSDYLTRNGIAVLRFDERGVGQSKGRYETATSADFANDVRDAVNWARSQSEIDPKRIGLIGHSEGGMIAPMVAAQDPNIAWIVLMAGTGVNGKEILLSQGRLILESTGATQEHLDQQQRIQELAFTMIDSIDPNSSIDAIIESQTDDLIKKLEIRNAKLAQSEELIRLAIKTSLIQLHQPWFRFFLKHEPGPVLEKVRCPVLAINGSKDLQVDAKLNLSKIETALKQSGNKDSTVLELADLNHLFQTSKTGVLSEYGTIEETIAPIALETISKWILDRNASNR